MSQHCNHDTPALATLSNPARYRRILWIALIINAAMFSVEMAAGWRAGSLSLLADAIDFAGDALNYGVSLAVLSAALAWRARAAVVKAVCMMGFGLLVLGKAIWSVWQGGVPDAATMGAVGFLALAANVAVAWMLYAFRGGRCQHAQRVAVFPQRCHWQHCRDAGRRRCGGHGQPLARPASRCRHGRAGPARRMAGHAAGAG